MERGADFACGLLQASGIKSFHRTTNLSSSAYGGVSPTEVVVDESDLAKAHKVLEAR